MSADNVCMTIDINTSCWKTLLKVKIPIHITSPNSYHHTVTRLCHTEIWKYGWRRPDSTNYWLYLPYAKYSTVKHSDWKVHLGLKSLQFICWLMKGEGLSVESWNVILMVSLPFTSSRGHSLLCRSVEALLCSLVLLLRGLRYCMHGLLCTRRPLRDIVFHEFPVETKKVILLKLFS